MGGIAGVLAMYCNIATVYTPRLMRSSWLERERGKVERWKYLVFGKSYNISSKILGGRYMSQFRDVSNVYRLIVNLVPYMGLARCVWNGTSIAA